MNKKLLLGAGVLVVLLAVVAYVFLTKPTSPVQEPIASSEEVKETTPASATVPVLYTQQGSAVVLARNGLSFNLPEGWTLTSDNKFKEWERVNLSLPTGEQVATIVCPAMGEGPYESATTTPVLIRNFTKAGVAYEANFEEWGSNRIEIIKTDHGTEGRYIGPPEKTDHVKSRVNPVGTPAYENGCILTAGNTVLRPETIEALKSIYRSWR